MRSFAWFFTGLLLLSGCAHVPHRSVWDARDVMGPGSKAGGAVSQEDDDAFKPHQVFMKDNGDITVHGIHLQHTRFDIPITINSRVEFWIDYFTGKGRAHFAKYLERSEYFIPYIAPILKQNNMPQDLVYLAMIESGFNNLARSHARAVGPWQFVSATGKRYGLMVNWWVDERRDVRKSTIAAVEYLRDLHGIFHNWWLAAAAYNAGEAKIARAIQRYGTTDFWALARHRFLRPETRDYVPKIIAAAIVAKNRTQFGFPEEKVHPAADEALAGDGEIVKVVKSDQPEEQLKKDPQDIKSVLEDGSAANDGNGEADVNNPADNDNTDKVDEDNVDETEAAATPIPPATVLAAEQTGSGAQVLAQPVPTPHLTKHGRQVGGLELAEFDVQSPADLLKIARASGLSYKTVKSLNPQLLRWCTPPNVSTYRVALPATVKARFLATYNHAAFPRQVKFMSYKVRHTQTLASVARFFGIRVEPISDLNGLSARSRVRRGARVLLPIPTDRSRSLASLEIRDRPHRYRYRHRYRHYKHYRRYHHYRHYHHKPVRHHYTRIDYRKRREARAKRWQARE